jgi:hypothetical protein
MVNTAHANEEPLGNGLTIGSVGATLPLVVGCSGETVDSTGGGDRRGAAVHRALRARRAAASAEQTQRQPAELLRARVAVAREQALEHGSGFYRPGFAATGSIEASLF